MSHTDSAGELASAQRSHLPTSFSTPSIYEDDGTGSYIIHGRGTCYTRACLTQIRRIRISIGVNGRSRTTLHISGLCLDYYNAERPAIVGQWISEFDSLDLSSREVLTEISTWTSRESANLSCGRTEVGRVTGIRIVTSEGQVKQINLVDTNRQVHVRFESNWYEELVCRLN